MLPDFPERLEHGPVTLLPLRGRVLLDGEPVSMTALEFKLLRYLMQMRNRIVSRDELIENAYDYENTCVSNSLEVTIHRIRRKLGSSVIKTVRSLGFICEDQSAQ